VQVRHTYFLLTAAGAGIALAMNQTHGVTLVWSQIPLGLAVSSWALSFFCGCRYVNYISSTLYANWDLLRVQVGEHPAVGRDPARAAAASEGIRLAIDDNSRKVSGFANWQFRFLIGGGVLYVAWHVLEMYLGAAALRTLH
jgi:hypothetical protein